MWLMAYVVIGGSCRNMIQQQEEKKWEKENEIFTEREQNVVL